MTSQNCIRDHIFRMMIKNLCDIHMFLHRMNMKNQKNTCWFARKFDITVDINSLEQLDTIL